MDIHSHEPGQVQLAGFCNDGDELTGSTPRR